MNFEEIQKNWQNQPEPESITVNTDIMLKEVQRNKQYFDAMIFWRDFREIGIAFVMTFVLIFMAINDQYLLLLCPAISCIFVSAFMTIDRIQFKKKTLNDKSESSLAECIYASLAHVNHQIWLLKNVAWWYLLPFAIGISIPFFEGAWQLRGSDMLMSFLIKTFGFVIILYIGIYYLNQYAVRKELQPRKEELQALLESIELNENNEL